MQRAEYERRIVAFLIDFILIFIVVTVELAFFDSYKSVFLFEVITLMMTINLATYLSFCYTLFRGNSIGSLFVGIKIVSNNGKPMMIRVGILRALLLSLGLLLFYNCIYMIYKRTQVSLFDESTQTMAIQKRGHPIGESEANFK